MRGILNIGMLLLAAVTVLAFKYKYAGDKSGLIRSKSDAGPQIVTFSIDDTATAENKMSRLNFYYHDSLAYGRHSVTIVGKRKQLLLSTPKLLLEASAKQTPFLIYPGENINIRYTNSDSVDMYISGNAKRTNELRFFRKLVQKTGNIYYGFISMPYHKKVNTLSNIHSLEMTINDLKNSRLQFLNTYARHFPVSDAFCKIAVNCIKSTAVTDSLLLYYNNRDLLNKQNLYKPFLAVKIKSTREIGFMPYPMYYVTCTNLVAMAIGGAPHDAISGTGIGLIKRFDFVEKNFLGETRDFLMANALFSAYLNGVQIPKNYINKFNIECVDKGYKKLIGKLNDNIKPMGYVKGSNKVSAIDGKTMQDLSAIIAKYKGKLVLLDFWASWCGPCREEMPYTVVLKKKYRGKNIAFVAISIDANVNDWQKAANEEALGSADNFLLLNADQASFVKHYSINAIPRYLLLGEDGRVLNEDAPRPSDPALQKLVDRYLSPPRQGKAD